MILLTYPESEEKPVRTIRLKPAVASTAGKIRIAVLGAGAFARSAHLPNLKSMSDRFILQAVATRTGHSAAAVAKQFCASYCTTDFAEVLADREVDAVIIATRHQQHGAMALAALQAGKHVLVEKPLALTEAELSALDAFISSNTDKPLPVLLTGYNRRFSPYAKCLAELLEQRSAPFMFNYRMNAGYIPLDNWVHGAEGGGRNLGEACHIYDLFTFLANAEVAEVSAHSIVPKSHHYGRSDNFVATMTFNDGSVASLTYTALGFKEYPKETGELYVDGKLITLSDYKSLEAHGVKGRSFKTSRQEKGLREELVAFADAINGGSWPIPWWQQLQSAKIALMVEKQITNAGANKE